MMTREEFIYFKEVEKQQKERLIIMSADRCISINSVYLNSGFTLTEDYGEDLILCFQEKTKSGWRTIKEFQIKRSSFVPRKRRWRLFK